MTNHPQNLHIIIFLARKQEYHRAISFLKKDENLMHPNMGVWKSVRGGVEKCLGV